MIINKNSNIILELPEAVRRAAANLKRDMVQVFCDSDTAGGDIVLERGCQEIECFLLKEENGQLKICAGDVLGFIYGLYEISRTWLGIEDFWFWNDQEIIKKESVEFPQGYVFRSTPFTVRYRGWFVNDEVLLHTWKLDGDDDKPWEMVFEALLRLGGNMVIPGTDRNSKRYRKLASDMGLMITHHHAEPLGAEMFARAYPNLNASYAENGEKFRGLWQDAIEQQKNMNVIWNLGFRGQGDCPFWADDPRYQTDEARGELMSKLIKIQYDMVKKELPEAVCSTNLYGETMDLYNKGMLKLPEDVIKIWADNGFGKMVSRRQGNNKGRVPAMPQEEGSHGIYYHVSFYDLQAANHITMLPNSPEFVRKELRDVLEHGANDFWIINCSNVKPHVYFLDLIAEMWKKGNIDIEKQKADYVKRYYGTKEEVKIADCLTRYWECALTYGSHEDDHAGEQFSNHVARILIGQCMTDSKKRSGELLWATEAETLEEQLQWYEDVCRKAAADYAVYQRECEITALALNGHSKQLFLDSILLQAQIHAHCYNGAYLTCQSLKKLLEGECMIAFYLAGKARKEYVKANQAMRDCEHGKWHGFYANECLTDIKQTAWVLKGLMSYIRMFGDGPHFYQWQREFLYPEEDRRVILIMNMENHLDDSELFELMEAKWDS